MFIEINNLKKSFGSDSNRVEVLRGVDFSIEKGDICVLLGPSGSGKSTLLNIIGGIDDADAGYISIGGERMADMNGSSMLRRSGNGCQKGSSKQRKIYSLAGCNDWH